MLDDLRETVELDEGAQRLIIKSSQDITPYLDANKAFHLGGSPWSQNRDMKHVASIPMIVALKWFHEEGIDVMNRDHLPAVRRKLNDPDYRYLRTGSGMLGKENSRVG